jgi:hypothetical protein
LLNTLREHPAVRAWSALRPRHARAAGVEVLKDTKQTRVFRLLAVGPDGAAVIAKRCRRESGAVERALYEEVFPRLPVLTPRCYGSLDDGPDSCWLFLEDAGSEEYAPEKGEHRALAARWLGRMHAGSGTLRVQGRLPQRGPGYYRRELDAATGRIQAHLADPVLGAEDREVLGDLLARCEVLGRRWQHVEALSKRMPRALVHGDFVPKNLRVRSGKQGPVLLVFDWEVAGWGLPAADVAMCGDLNTYAETVRGDWPQLCGPDLRRLAFLGKVFRLASSLSWASWDLGSTRTARCLGRLRCYRADLAAVLGAGRWWS